jgi:mono/diheme cytochrome c family protein
MLTYALGGSAEPPASDPFPAGPPEPPVPLTASAEQVEAGGDLYHHWCAVCHGIGAVAGGVIPDLRYANAETHERFEGIALGGLYQSRGMPSFAGRVTPDELEAIRGYVLSLAHEAAAAEPDPSS